MKPSILVAVDIVQDQVVRLTRGELRDLTVYGHDPVETAVEWEANGADRLHVIDLDAAIRPGQSNSKAIETLIERVGIPVQVGG
ncbi:MAG: 1-(5-phosphoribosyl)-5-[(5-phosphoribosylamino)methylideneamino]imidazole-4-carboxamide isomerase, partial [Actinobacteria bacterium]|nr:1-(5-phosphoribosyl)-5-[(5-phosphoribosylamino)methylideneamino]imidazole-4-carboxamide isomerase [Actinomycetota bacterium]